MKPNLLRRPAPFVRTPPGGGFDRRLASLVALPITALVLVAATLLAGATFVAAMALLPTTLPTLLIGWVASIGLAFALPMAVVRGVVAAIERLE